MMKEADRTSVTLDRRERRDRRGPERRSDERRGGDRRSGEDRRSGRAAIDFPERRTGERRSGADRRGEDRRSGDRRISERRTDAEQEIPISDEDLHALVTPPRPRARILAQILLLVGLILLLSVL